MNITDLRKERRQIISDIRSTQEPLKLRDLEADLNNNRDNFRIELDHIGSGIGMFLCLNPNKKEQNQGGRIALL